MLAVPMPVVAATLVSALVFYAGKLGPAGRPAPRCWCRRWSRSCRARMLTLGMVELAYGDMVSGSSRLITGFVQLVLLAFGLAAGAALLGAQPGTCCTRPRTIASGCPGRRGLGVLVFGLGVYLHFSAPRNSLLWLLVVLLAAIAAQRLAAPVCSAPRSAASSACWWRRRWRT